MWYTLLVDNCVSRPLESPGGLSAFLAAEFLTSGDRGEYEHCFTLESPRGDFVQLTPTVAEYIARAIETGREANPSQRRSALQAREARTEKEYDEWAWEALSGRDPSLNTLRPPG